jgi:hypothetical protein
MTSGLQLILRIDLCNRQESVADYMTAESRLGQPVFGYILGEVLVLIV